MDSLSLYSAGAQSLKPALTALIFTRASARGTIFGILTTRQGRVYRRRRRCWWESVALLSREKIKSIIQYTAEVGGDVHGERCVCIYIYTHVMYERGGDLEIEQRLIRQATSAFRISAPASPRRMALKAVKERDTRADRSFTRVWRPPASCFFRTTLFQWARAGSSLLSSLFVPRPGDFSALSLAGIIHNWITRIYVERERERETEGVREKAREWGDRVNRATRV